MLGFAGVFQVVPVGKPSTILRKALTVSVTHLARSLNLRNLNLQAHQTLAHNPSLEGKHAYTELKVMLKTPPDHYRPSFNHGIQKTPP